MNRLAIITVGDEMELLAAFCREQNLGLEVSDFAFPKNLEGDLTERITRHKSAVEGITAVVGDDQNIRIEYDKLNGYYFN